VVLSTVKDKKLINECKKIGIDGYIVKPIKKHSFIEKVLGFVGYKNSTKHESVQLKGWGSTHQNHV